MPAGVGLPNLSIEASGVWKLRRNCFIALNEELVVAFSDDVAQKRMIEVFASEASHHEKKRKHSEICLEIQRPVLSKYGFEVSQSGIRDLIREGTNPDLLLDNEFHMTAAHCFWLQHWMEFKAPSPWDGRAIACIRKSDVAVYVANADDCVVVHGIDLCRQRLVSAHKEIYEKAYPDAEFDAWSRLMGIQDIREALNNGILILYAVAQDTDEVIGYISCSFFDREEPHMKIHHLVVLPCFEGKRVGKLLFDELMAHLSKIAPRVILDVRLNVFELNYRAALWYFRLGFAIMEIFTATLQSATLGDVPVVLFRMRLKQNTQREVVSPCLGLGEQICFGEHIVSEQVHVVHASAPLDFIYSFMFSNRELWSLHKTPPATIRSYIEVSGLHRLEDGRQINIAVEFCRGYVFFTRPLHTMTLGLQEQPHVLF